MIVVFRFACALLIQFTWSFSKDQCSQPIHVAMNFHFATVKNSCSSSCTLRFIPPSHSQTAVTWISTNKDGKAKSAPTHARMGLLSASIHLTHTAFILAKSLAISLSQILAVNNLDLSVLASFRRPSITSKIFWVCSSTVAPFKSMTPIVVTMPLCTTAEDMLGLDSVPIRTICFAAFVFCFCSVLGSTFVTCWVVSKKRLRPKYEGLDKIWIIGVHGRVGSIPRGKVRRSSNNAEHWNFWWDQYLRQKYTTFIPKDNNNVRSF